jgi:hypothetical protein
VGELYAELDPRLDRTLDEFTKRELAADAVLAGLTAGGSGEASAPSTAPDVESGAEVTPGTLTTARGDEEKPPTVLARVVFRDGACFEFTGKPSDGEIGMSYRGEDETRWLAATGELVSPLRLFCSLAPSDAPVPWLLAAVDRQPDRAGLIGTRSLCDTVAHTLPVRDDLIRLRVPGLEGGWWVPDNLGIGFFCGINGEAEFDTNVCQFNAAHLPSSSLLFPDIQKCTAALSVDLTHNSTESGSWKRRKTSTGWVAACGSPARIRHQYRKLGFFSWQWETANNDVVGPANYVGTLWLGIVMRRRRIIYTREGQIGGFRAWSRFSQHL